MQSIENAEWAEGRTIFIVDLRGENWPVEIIDVAVTSDFVKIVVDSKEAKERWDELHAAAIEYYTALDAGEGAELLKQRMITLSRRFSANPAFEAYSAYLKLKTAVKIGEDIYLPET